MSYACKNRLDQQRIYAVNRHVVKAPSVRKAADFAAQREWTRLKRSSRIGQRTLLAARMPRTRTKALLIALPVLVVCVVAVGAYFLWARLTGAGGGSHPAAMQALPASADSALNSVDTQPRKLPRIGSGTAIDMTPPAGWSHLVLHGIPRIATGDVEQISPAVSRLVSLFELAILADVARDANSQPSSYWLRTVAVGLATDIAGRKIVVSSKSQKSLGANLRLRELSALSGNEANLDQMIQVARTPTMVVFDATAIMRRGDENRQVLNRHALVVRPEDGRLSTFVWTLAPNSAGDYELAETQVRLLSRNLRQDRTLFVDARRFVLGMPAQEAVALVDLPPGMDIPMSAPLQAVAGSSFQSPDDVLRLQSLLCEAAESLVPRN